MDIQVKTDLKKLQKKMDVLQHKTFNKVLSEGMNYTGAKVVNTQREMLLRKLEKPRKTSITAIVMSQFAKPNKRGLKVTVRVKSYATKFLYYIYTGENEPARSQSYPSPTDDGMARRNQFGNIVTQRGILKRLDKTKESQRKGSRFIGVPKGEGSKVYGIWERQGRKGRGGLDLLVAFTPFIRHRKFIDWFKLSQKVVQNNFYKEVNKQFSKRVKQVLR